MARFDGALGLLVTEGCFVNEQVRPPRVLDRRGAGPGVPGDHHPASRTRRSDEHRGLDHPAILQRDGQPAVDLTPQGTLGDAELPRMIRIEPALPGFLDQRVAERR
jgi:hypothetical protein